MLRAIFRHAVYARLRHFPLSEGQATHWAEFMRRRPAYFAEFPFRQKRQLKSGAWMRLGMIDVIERRLSVAGEWDEDVAQAMRSCIKPGSTVVDIGANIGYFSMLASSLTGPGGKVLSIEPSQRNMARLCEHLWINQCTNTTVLSMAASSGKGWADIHFPTENNAGAASLRALHSTQAQQTLLIALDDVFDGYELSPGFIKIDVEGWELEALRGMRRTLERCKPDVVCELTQQFLAEIGQSATELVGYMEALGYQCWLISGAENLPRGALLSVAEGNIPDVQVDVLFRHAASGFWSAMGSGPTQDPMTVQTQAG